MGRKRSRVPWLWLTTTVTPGGGVGSIGVASGRTIDSIIIVVLLAASLGFLAIWLIALRGGLPAEDR